MKNDKRRNIVSRIRVSDYQRLKNIADNYGYRSVYALMTGIVYSFLRVADPEHDDSDNVLPVDLIKMFSGVKGLTHEIHDALIVVKSKPKKRHHHEYSIAEDIREIFDDAQEIGNEFPDDIKKRNER
jgi:hypothetical protein